MTKVKNKVREIEKSILPWLGVTTKGLDYFIADQLAENGLHHTKPQMILLRRLMINNGIPHNNLAFITNRDKTSLSRLVNTMEKKGLVERKVSKQDKRVNLVYITPLGISTVKKAFPIIQTVIAKVQDNISDKDIETTINVLKQISVNIQVDELHPHLFKTKQ